MSKQAMPSNIIQEIFEVKRKKFVTPNYIRVTLTGENIIKFVNTTTGTHNKIFIPPMGLNEIHFLNLDLKKNAMDLSTRGCSSFCPHLYSPRI